MIPTDFKKNLIKGNVGEEIIKSYLEDLGWIIYKPVTDGAHGFDIMCYKNKEGCIMADVKTKARMNKIAATGINQSHFEKYNELSKKNTMPFWILFVDEMLGKIYGNSLDTLEMKRYIDGVTYPFIMKTRNNTQIRLYHLNSMKDIAILDTTTRDKLRAISRRNYQYKTI